MTTVAIVQARMSSTRLPGKVLLDLAGEPMLARVVERARRSAPIDEVVVATTTGAEDDAIVDLAVARGWPVHRGSRDDVLDRYVGAARAHGATTIVRITSDCPLLDPEVVTRVVRGLDQGADYCSNVLPTRTFPRGLDVEAMPLRTLERAATEATQPHEREHVTPYVHAHPQRFRLTGVKAHGDFSAHRWTVDTPEDLALVRAVFAAFGPAGPGAWLEVLALLERRPELVSLNAHVEQKRLGS